MSSSPLSFCLIDRRQYVASDWVLSGGLNLKLEISQGLRTELLACFCLNKKSLKGAAVMYNAFKHSGTFSS